MWNLYFVLSQKTATSNNVESVDFKKQTHKFYSETFIIVLVAEKTVWRLNAAKVREEYRNILKRLDYFDRQKVINVMVPGSNDSSGEVDALFFGHHWLSHS